MHRNNTYQVMRKVFLVSFASLLTLFLVGCASTTSYTPGSQGPPRGAQVHVAEPMEPQTVGLYLEIERWNNSESLSFEETWNVKLHFLNNSNLKLWTQGKIVFYAERDGTFYPLRVVDPRGWGGRAYSWMSQSVSLPRPPKPGKYRVFAVLFHSNDPVGNEQQLWNKNIVSNSIFVDFQDNTLGKR